HKGPSHLGRSRAPSLYSSCVLAEHRSGAIGFSSLRRPYFCERFHNRKHTPHFQCRTSAPEHSGTARPRSAFGNHFLRQTLCNGTIAGSYCPMNRLIFAACLGILLFL